LAFHSGREADHSPPSSAGVKEWVELYLHYPNTHSWRGAQLGGAQGQLYLHLLPLQIMMMMVISKHQVHYYLGKFFARKLQSILR
jgi:hypothetical protein